MKDALVRLVWFFIIACAVSYAVFIVAGSSIEAQAVDESRIVLIRDSLMPGVHNLSGIIMAPSTCAQISVRSMQLSTTTYSLIFTSWEEPSVACSQEDTPRSFRAVVFAPAAGVQFIGSLDDQPLMLAVIPVVEHN
jgi:hypothetical protein